MTTNSPEVTITCITDAVHLRDLGIHMTRGSRAYVSLTAAEQSRDLKNAKIDGTVVTQTLRFAAIRTQENVSSDTVTSQSPRARPVVPQVVVPPQVDMTPFVGVMGDLVAEIRGLRQDLAKAPRATPVDMGPVLALLQQVQGMGPISKPQGDNNAGDDVMFIPSNLTGSGTQDVSLTVLSESASDVGVSDAMGALKAVRKKSHGTTKE